jgi:L-lactate dehydrogenase complex protein LldF
VHWAKGADDVNRIVVEIARKANVQKVVKAKSMATEEVHLNDALRRRHAGRGDRPGRVHHPVGRRTAQPHRRTGHPPPRRGHFRIFQKELDMPPTLDPQVICNVARTRAAPEFLSADMGISGCNFAIAETGTSASSPTRATGA